MVVMHVMKVEMHTYGLVTDRLCVQRIMRDVSISMIPAGEEGVCCVPCAMLVLQYQEFIQ